MRSSPRPPYPDVDNLASLQEKHLDETWKSLYTHVVDLGKDCSSFKDQVQAFVAFHKRNRKTLQHHMQLLELLEVPQLVDACIRTGLLDEALELALFVNNLERRHLLAHEVKETAAAAAPRRGADVIQRIVGEVHGLLGGLQASLLLQLTEASALPKLILIMATLRKMDSLFIDRLLSLQRFQSAQSLQSQLLRFHGTAPAVSEDRLRDLLRTSYVQAAEAKHQMDFLEARSVHLLRQPSSGSAALGAYGRAMELLEQKRAGVFAIITQFQALFLDSQGQPQGYTSFTAQTALHAWCSATVRALCAELTQLLQQIEDGSVLKSIAEQALYFAGRLAQVNLDMTQVIVQLFEQIVLSKLAKDCGAVCKHFASILSTERIRLGDDSREQIIPLYSAQDETVAAPSAPKGEVEAPTAMLRYPPIAYATNALLTALNFLREIPLKSVYHPALQCVLRALDHLMDTVALQQLPLRKLGEKYFGEGFMSNMGGKGPQGSEDMPRLYAEAIALDVLPHLLVCFQSIYDEQMLDTFANWKSTHSISSGSTSSAQRHLLQDVDDAAILFHSNAGSSCLLEEVKGLWQRAADRKLLDAAVMVSKQRTFQRAGSRPQNTITTALPEPVPTPTVEVIEDSGSALAADEGAAAVAVDSAEEVGL